MPEVSIIVPTYNEVGNIDAILADLRQLSLQNCEIIFVDDNSPDRTHERVASLAQSDPYIRLILRTNRRGLSSAIFDGLCASTAPYLIVLDADRQHDHALIPAMYDTLRSGEAEIVIGSRYVNEPRKEDGFSSSRRSFFSWGGNQLARFLLRVDVMDPMSGFFGIKRDVFLAKAKHINPVGYKVLLELLFACRDARIKELAYVFRERTAGTSKLNLKVAWDFACQCLSHLCAGLIPPEMMSFLLVGGIGAIFHFTTYFALMYASGDFALAHISAVFVATLLNFFLNNIMTFSTHKLSGWRLLIGLALYLATSSVGLILNLSVALIAFTQFGLYSLLSSLLGVLIDTVWKYTLSSHLVWRSR